MAMNGQKIIENIFFLVTCISVFTCIIRSDYNFAMGLLSYYMIKNMDAKNKVGSEISKIARTVLLLTVMTIVMDFLWIFVMREVWSGKPLKNANAWKAFENIRTVTLFLSFVNMALKGIAVVLLIPIMRGSRIQNPLTVSSHQ